MAAGARGDDLDELLNDPGFWQSSAEALAGAHPRWRLEWNSNEHKLAKVAWPTMLFALPIDEAQIVMGDGKPVEFNAVFFDRGDSGDMPKEYLSGLVSNAQQRVGAWMGSKAVALTDQLKTTGVRRGGLVWTNAGVEVRLVWAYSTKDPYGRLGYRAEYVKLRVVPAGAKQATGGAGTAVSAGAMKSKIKRDANGDVVLVGVPMVDQGEKGYCAVASAERIMRFYGMNVDQHELAQLAASSAESGTDPRAMLESLRRVGLKLNLKVKVLEDFSVQAFLRLIERYNQAAKKKKAPPITYGNELNLSAIYGAMKPEILREVRTKSSQDIKNFMGDVSRNVDAAIPLLWGVQLGKIEEKPQLPKQTAGGHMRLIIGYNTKTGEVLYTDSWGPGHELKRMNLDDAWTITSALFLIEPRRTTL